MRSTASPLLDFGQLPATWTQANLGEEAIAAGGFIQTGPFGSQLHASDYQRDGIPVINPTHMLDNRINREGVPRVSKATADRLSRHYVQAGDILFGRRGDIGRHAVVTPKESGWLCGTGCFLVRAAGSKLNPRYLSFWLTTAQIRAWLADHAAGAIMANLNGDVISNIPLVIPPKPEQEKIAAVLWKVQRAIEVEEKLVATTRELKQSALRQLFTRGLRKQPQKETPYGEVPESWEIKALSEWAFVQSGATKGRMIQPEDAIDVPYLRVANVQDGHLDLTEMKTIRIRRDELDGYRLQRDDVVLTEGGDFDKLGRGFIWEDQIEPCIHQNHVFAVRVNRDRLWPRYFAYLAQSPYGKAYFLTVAHKTTNLACINTTKLRAFPVLRPELDEQKEIASILQTIDRKISLHERKRAALSGLFQTLLHQLMTAQIRVHRLDIDTSEVKTA